MASTPGNATGTPLLLVGDVGGITVVDPSTPLRRLNYFDGKFLRADDFNVEQGYLRQLVALSNQGLGAGVVYGYDTTLGSGDTLQIGPGLAIAPSGQVLLLQSTVTQSVQALIDATKQLAARPPDASGKSAGFSDCVEVAAPPPTTVLPVSDLYVIAICAAEALCGQEDVFGIACQDACVSTTERPYRLDGVVLRAIPLQLTTPLPTSKAVAIDSPKYLRTKVAQAWFADERRKHPGSISRAGLLSAVWCVGAGYDAGCCEVPLAVVARSGSTTLFLDAWTVRRERIEAPARRYWQWAMAMRPCDVFLAQVLQFQCQLADALGTVAALGSRAGGTAPATQRALDEATRFVAEVRSGLASYRSLAGAASPASNAATPALLSLSLTQVSDLHARLSALLQTELTPAAPTQRVLISLGLCHLSPAGYLPVVTGSHLSVNQQVRALLGEGLDLRFCITPADNIALAIDEAQHLDRISLLQGLDDPANKPAVDILVPDGQAMQQGSTSSDGLYDAALNFSTQQTGGVVCKGAAREQALPGGGTALYCAGAGLSQAAVGKMQVLSRALLNPTATTRPGTVTANLYGNAFIKKTAALGSRLDLKLATAATQARRFIAAGQVAAGGGSTGIEAGARASSANETVDGLWISGRVEQRLRSLGVGAHSAVQLRAVLGTRPATPQAMELSFAGTLSIASASTASGALALAGTLNGVLSLGLVHEDQAEQSTAETLLTERFNWPAMLAFAGDSASGSATLDLGVNAKSGQLLRIARRLAGNGSQIGYTLSLLTPNAAGGPATEQPLGQLLLGADAGVVDASNAYHLAADQGLDLVQAALVVSEPGLKAQASSLLFPAADAGTPELVIQAVRDWVAFTRRRERRCAADVAPPQPLPPRRYRVLEQTFDSVDAAHRFIADFEALLKSPAALAQQLQALLAVAGREKLHLVVGYAGGSAVAQSDLVAAEVDWKTFGPGKDIHYTAVGALGETDAALQIGRLATFEAAIAADSREVKGAAQDVLLPYPEAGLPEDADGVMLFVTVKAPPPVVKTDLLTVGVRSSAVTHVVPYFQKGLPNTTLGFQNDVPQGGNLANFAGSSLPAGVQYSAVTLWSVAASPDSGAATRALAVRDAVAKAGRMSATAPTSVQVLTSTLQSQLVAAGLSLNGIDDVIAVELNQPQ